MNFLNQVHLLTSTNSTSSYYLIIMVVILLAFFYFGVYRPQRKQEKETNAMRNGLQVGDEITTIGGIIGKIVSIKGETCMIETGKDRTKIRILKSAVKTVDVPASVANGAIPVDTAAKKEIAPEQTDSTEEAAEGTADKEKPAEEAVEETAKGRKARKKKK
ncbi:MAG: preprotein translocase subunit YajC [Eubacteriales bacterium]